MKVRKNFFTIMRLSLIAVDVHGMPVFIRPSARDWNTPHRDLISTSTWKFSRLLVIVYIYEQHGFLMKILFHPYVVA